MTFISLFARFAKFFSFSFLFTAILIQNSSAQIDESSELFKVLSEKDSLLFEEGFNKCNLELTESLISKELDFYHDVSGIQDREMFFNAIRKNICSGSLQKPIRKLAENSLKVFPLRNQGELYGAIQKGSHNFFLREDDKELVQTSSAKFTHVWILEEEIWKLKTVLSYDHQSIN